VRAFVQEMAEACLVERELDQISRARRLDGVESSRDAGERASVGGVGANSSTTARSAAASISGALLRFARAAKYWGSRGDMSQSSVSRRSTDVIPDAGARSTR
jgi:hypothetical protein